MNDTADAALIETARRYQAARVRRPRLFGCGAAADPAWDILFHLLLAQLEHRMVTISSAAEASLTLPTTGLRWIVLLRQAGLVTRVGDLGDPQPMTLRLTEDGERLARDAVADLAR